MKDPDVSNELIHSHPNPIKDWAAWWVGVGQRKALLLLQIVDGQGSTPLVAVLLRLCWCQFPLCLLDQVRMWWEWDGQGGVETGWREGRKGEDGRRGRIQQQWCTPDPILYF